MDPQRRRDGFRDCQTGLLAFSAVVALFAGCAQDPQSGSLAGTPTNGDPAATGPGGTGSPLPDGGGATPGGANPPGFDFSTFQTTIQPILDTAEGKGCTANQCHGGPSGIGGFVLTRQPAPDSAEMHANFDAVTSRCDPTVPDQSLFYLHATVRHGGGQSALVSQAQASAILSFIQHAAGSPPVGVTPPADGGAAEAGGGAPSANCIPAASFNLGVFTSEILPILFGQLDYNTPPGQPVANEGCARSTCHGAASNPLHISPTSTPAQNLASFGCFINAQSPSLSAVLACPLNEPSCPKNPHPGQRVFRDTTDLNYQRILSFLYSAQGVSNPLDFAFFARQIAPLFSDPANGGLGATGGRSCNNTGTCHGVSSVTQTPPNLSNFPILASATSKAQLQAVYWSAAGFVNFSRPNGSELFLFPTDLVSDVTQPYASGFHHPGGVDFAADSAPAQAILSWAGGLRPDGNGFQPNWLVAGTYSASQLNQFTTVGDESKLAPTIFDPDGASQFNNGQWDAQFSNNKFVDLNQSFPGVAGSGRVAYAVSYALNTTGSDIQNAVIQVNSPNAVLLYVGGQAVAQSQNPGNNSVSGIATFAASGPGAASTRILVKVLQRAEDTQFGFSVSLSTNSNIPLTNTSGELVFRLDPTGGN